MNDDDVNWGCLLFLLAGVATLSLLLYRAGVLR